VQGDWAFLTDYIPLEGFFGFFFALGFCFYAMAAVGQGDRGGE
jgi:hypothetical protein